MVGNRPLASLCRRERSVLSATDAYGLSLAGDVLLTHAAELRSSYIYRLISISASANRQAIQGATRLSASGEHFFKLQQFYSPGSYFGFAHGRLSDGALSHRPRNSCRNSGGSRL